MKRKAKVLPDFTAHCCRTQAPTRIRHAALLIVSLLLAAGGVSGNDAAIDPATQAAAKSMEAKLAVLGGSDSQPSATYPAVIITAYEANAYMKVHAAETFPKGVSAPTVRVEPEHAIISADVNFDELSRSYPNPNDMGPKILAAMFKGTQRATITGKVQSDDAGVRMQIESVVIGSTTVPNWLVDYVIQNVVQPTYKIDLSKPLPYPDHVSRVVLGSGQVTFLRGPRSPKH